MIILGIDFDETKNQFLKERRGVNFDDVLEALTLGNVLDEIEQKHAGKYINQKILVLKIANYAYAVPFVFDEKTKIMFLKTLFPSRTLNKKYLGNKS